MSSTLKKLGVHVDTCPQCGDKYNGTKLPMVFFVHMVDGEPHSDDNTPWGACSEACGVAWTNAQNNNTTDDHYVAMVKTEEGRLVPARPS